MERSKTKPERKRFKGERKKKIEKESPFNESEVDKYFQHFEWVVQNLNQTMNKDRKPRSFAPVCHYCKNKAKRDFSLLAPAAKP